MLGAREISPCRGLRGHVALRSRQGNFTRPPSGGFRALHFAAAAGIPLRLILSRFSATAVLKHFVHRQRHHRLHAGGGNLRLLQPEGQVPLLLLVLVLLVVVMNGR